MASSAQAVAQDPRSESDRFMSGLEHDRGWQCLWQQRMNNGRRLIEGYYYPKAGTHLIVIKDYDGSVAGRKWPKMVGCEVYAPLDGSNTWTGLEKALDQLEAAKSE